MFLVLTTQNIRDTDVARVAPRMVTADPKKALEAARAVYVKDRETPFVANVIIYELAPDQEYTLWDVSERLDNKMIVFVACEHSIEDRWVEIFYGSFKRFDPAVQKNYFSKCGDGTCGHGHAGDPPLH